MVSIGSFLTTSIPRAFPILLKSLSKLPCANFQRSGRASHMSFAATCLGLQQRALLHRAPPSTSTNMGRRAATNAVSPHIRELISAADPTLEVVTARTLTTLWAGYGTILEVETVDERGKRQQLVVKEVSPPPHESGAGHDRKLHSYQVEAFFYQQLAPRLAGHPVCHVPRPLLARSSLTAAGGTLSLVLSDLRPQFPSNAGSLGLEHAKAVLSWLAAFHAAFWEQGTPAEVWASGCYWHLDTRQEEFESMGAEWRELQRVAHEIDRQLKGGQPDGSTSGEFRTLTHGDAKAANILFSAARPLQCALYDLQYCGGGYGVKDVVYLLASSVDARVLEQQEEALLAHYHAQLVGELGAERGAVYTRAVLDRHYQLAFLDYVRFMAGWGFWGSVSWAKRRARQYLQELGPELHQAAEAAAAATAGV